MFDHVSIMPGYRNMCADIHEKVCKKIIKCCINFAGLKSHYDTEYNISA